MQDENANHGKKKNYLILFLIVMLAAAVLIFMKFTPSQPVETASEMPEDADLQAIVEQSQTWGSILTHFYRQIMPDFEMADIQGNIHKLSDYRGKDIIVVFWATWCPACKQEIPHLIKLRNEKSEDELAILAVSNEDAGQLRPFVATRGINYTVIVMGSPFPQPFDRVNSFTPA